MQNILIVDDNAPLARFTRSFVLSRICDVQVHLAHDALAARREFDAAAPDVVVLDVNLPDADGVALLGELAARRPGTAFVLISAEGVDDKTISRLRPLGLAGVLWKPYTAQEIADVVRRALDGSALLRRSAADPDSPASVVSVDPEHMKAELSAILAELFELRAILAQATSEQGVRQIVDSRVEPLIDSVQRLAKVARSLGTDSR